MIQRFESFITGITVCYKYIQRIKNAEMTELGLKGIHVSCMFYLNSNPEGLTAAELCSVCCEDKATISRIVADLRKKGYIQPASGKNYREKLHLTPAGRQIAQQMIPLIKNWVAAGGEGLTESQREDFYESLSLIAKNLHKKLEN